MRIRRRQPPAFAIMLMYAAPANLHANSSQRSRCLANFAAHIRGEAFEHLHGFYASCRSTPSASRNFNSRIACPRSSFSSSVGSPPAAI